MKNTWNRKILVSVTDNQKDGLTHSDSGNELLENEEIEIISMEDIERFNQDFEILGNDRLGPNMMLLLSPYNDNTYVRVEEARSLLAIEKGLLTIRFCSLLGAKSIEVIDFKQVDLDKETKGKGKVGYNELSAEAKLKQQSLEKIKNQITVSGTATGGKPKFEIAEKMLKENRLNSDPFFRNLFNMAKDYEGEENRIGVLTQSVLLSHSMQDSLEIIGKVKFPTGYVKGAYKSSLDQKVQIYMTLRISFMEDNNSGSEILKIEEEVS